MSATVSGSGWSAFVHGAASLERQGSGGMAVHRLPPSARMQFEDAMLSYVEACPAGVTLRFETDAASVDLALDTTTLAAVGADPASIALVVRDGREQRELMLRAPNIVVLDAENNVVDVVRQPTESISIPVSGDGPVEILLPHNARVELGSLHSDGALTPVPEHGRRWTHHGSSISQGMNAVSAARTWPAAAASALRWSLTDLSFAGNAQLDGFTARVIRDAPADLITLKLGINLVNADSMRERSFRPALHAFLDTIREKHPDTPIVLISAVSCPIHEHAAGPVMMGSDGRARAAERSVEKDDGALTLEITRGILAEAVERRADPRLAYLDGRRLFGVDDTAMLYDGLHPDQAGLDLIAGRFAELVPSVLQDLLAS